MRLKVNGHDYYWANWFGMHRIDPSIHLMFAHFAHMIGYTMENENESKTKNNEHTYGRERVPDRETKVEI